MGNVGAYFIQITDAHLSPTDVEGNATLEIRSVPEGDALIPYRDREYLASLAPGHLAEAVEEIAALDPAPELILFTGDQTTCGTRAEIERFLDITAPLGMPRCYNASNHDLGRTPEVFDDVCGPRRRIVDAAGLRFFIMDEYRRFDDDRNYAWRTVALPEHVDWIRAGRADAPDRPAALVTHAPILPLGERRFAEYWDRPETADFVDVLSDAGVRWHLSGHWHRNMTWDLGPVRAITTGALVGFQCSGPEPFFLFPVRPGYRIFHWDGRTLRSAWRTLRAWIETSIVQVGPAHAHGPRPQVRAVTVCAPVALQVTAYAPGEPVAAVEWGVADLKNDNPYRADPVMHQTGWQPMRRTWDGLWSQWQATLDPDAFAPGEYVLLSRARRRQDDDWYGHDAVPLTIARDAHAAPAASGPERLFALSEKVSG